MLRPLNDYILVKLDPLPETPAGSIILIGSGEERLRTGVVLRVGPGRWMGSVRAPVDVVPGDKVAFWRENLEHQQGKKVTAILQDLEEGVGLLRAPDILYVME